MNSRKRLLVLKPPTSESVFRTNGSSKVQDANTFTNHDDTTNNYCFSTMWFLALRVNNNNTRKMRTKHIMIITMMCFLVFVLWEQQTNIIVQVFSTVQEQDSKEISWIFSSNNNKNNGVQEFTLNQTTSATVKNQVRSKEYNKLVSADKSNDDQELSAINQSGNNRMQIDTAFNNDPTKKNPSYRRMTNEETSKKSNVILPNSTIAATISSSLELNMNTKRKGQFTDPKLYQFLSEDEVDYSTTTSSQGISSNYKNERATTTTTITKSKETQQHPPVVVITLSSSQNYERRNVIRSTWGNGHAIYFVVVAPASSGLNENDFEKMQLLLVEEQDLYNDLIIIDDGIQVESYALLPYKLKYALGWIYRMYYCSCCCDNGYDDSSSCCTNDDNETTMRLNCTTTVEPPRWVMKVDDDSYVHLDSLYEKLLRPLTSSNNNILVNTPGCKTHLYDNDIPKQNSNSSSRATNCSLFVLIGQLKLDGPVFRTGKWAENVQVYPNRFYPPFALGSSGYVVNDRIVQYIGQQYQHDQQLQQQQYPNNKTPPILQIYQGEDTSLGIWLDEAHLLYGQQLPYLIDSQYFTSSGNCYQPDYIALSIGHGFTSETIEKCYKYHQREKMLQPHRQQQEPSSNYSSLHQEQMSRIWFLETLAQHTSSSNDNNQTASTTNMSKDRRPKVFRGSFGQLQIKEAETEREHKALIRSEKRRIALSLKVKETKTIQQNLTTE